jgi:hypothetical protein
VAKRSKPMIVAPLIPLLGIVGIFGVDRFAHTRFLTAFVVMWVVLFAGLFVWIASQTLAARRARGR